MLDPNSRSLLTDALTPPPAMHFDCGMATTFSLDPTALLTLPIHLAWLAAGGDQEVLADPIRLLEAMRRVSSQLTVFCDRGRMLVPDHHNALFGMLETMVHEARAPQGGAFHPKVWLLRFVDEKNDNPLLRLMVLSRNLTFDNSWDLSLQLEGRPGKRLVPDNAPLVSFLKVVTKRSIKKLSIDRQEMLKKLGVECRKCTWELPSGFQEVKFHLIGADSNHWLPPQSDELAVISPFVRETALKALAQTTKKPRFLLARGEELDNVSTETIYSFETCSVLAEQAETGDSEDETSATGSGLHAKAYLLRKGWYTHLFVGSANASDRVMQAGLKIRNLEILVELRGLTSKVGGIDKLLDEDGIFDILTPYLSPGPDEPKTADSAARKSLERVRDRLARATFSLACLQIDDAWQLTLTGDSPIDLECVSLLIWPLTIARDRGANGEALVAGGEVVLQSLATEQVTSLLGFGLTFDGEELRFGLEVPIDNPPLDRDAAIMRLMLRNRDGFLRYLLMMLEDLSGEGAGARSRQIKRAGGEGLGKSGDDFPLFEVLARSFVRDPERLRSISKLVKDLASGTGDSVVPPEFLSLWSVFEQALAKGGEHADHV